MERMESAGCPNATPLITMLNAEEQARRIRTDEASLLSAYSRGIDSLAKHGLLPFEAILNETAGFDFARRGRRTGAEQHFQRALHIYKH